MAGAYRAALWAAGLELAENGEAVVREPFDVIVVSKDFPGSKRLLREVADACEELSVLGPGFGCDVQATEIRLENGRRISALPCSDKAIRGCTAAFIADEFAFWRQPEACWAALKSVSDPTLGCDRGRPGLIISTPWDAGSLAHRIMTEWPFPHHSIDIYQAKRDGFPIDIDRAFAELGIQELIDSEYRCLWSRGGASFFAPEKLRDATEDDLPDGWEKAPVRIGIDIGGGRGRDFTAIVQWRFVEGAWWMVGLKAFNDRPIDQQVRAAADWIQDDIDGSCQVDILADQGVMGLDFIRLLELALSKRTRTTIQGVAMGPAEQEAYASAGRRLLERRQLKLYTGAVAGGDANGATALQLELSHLKASPGTGGRMKFTTPRDPTKGHCDRAWAALIGLSEADEVATPVPLPANLRQPTARWQGMPGRGFG